LSAYEPVNSESPVPSQQEPPPETRALGPPPPLRHSGYLGLLHAVRARQHRQMRIAGALLGLAFFVALIALSGFVAPLSVKLARACLILAPIGFLAFWLWRGFYLPWRWHSDERDAARLVGSRIPELSFDLLAAVELRRELDRVPDFSPELARAFLRQADARAEQFDPERAVDPRRARPAWIVLACVATAAATLLLARPAAWWAGVGHALWEPAGAPRPTQREPITGDIELTYRYPAYTGLQARTIAGTNGEISALAGTEVTLKTRADRPVHRAELAIDQTRVPLQVTADRELSGSFVLSKSGTYRFVFLSSSGRQVAEGPELPIQVEPDEPPKVTLLSPAEEVEIDPGQRVVLKYSASDDFGLTSLELVYRSPRMSEEKRVRLRLSEERRFNGEYRWDLAELKLVPGERVSYYLAAHDNDEVSGKKLGVSRTQYIKIYSAAEHRRDALLKAEALWERLVGHLGTRLEGPDRGADKQGDKVAEQQSVDAAGNELCEEMASAGHELSRQRDAPEELWTALINIGDNLQRKVGTTASVRRLFVRSFAQRSDLDASRRLARATEDEIQESEKDVLYLEALLDRQKLQEIRDLAKQMSQDRRELASLIERYKQTKDSSLRENMLKQAEALRSRIEELMRRMAELAKGIRDEHLNYEALKDLAQQKNLGEELAEVQRLLQEDKADEALTRLQQMAMQMEEMLRQLDDSQEHFGAEQNPELSAKFQKFVDDLQDTTHQQKRLADQTKEVRERYRKQMRERLIQKGQALKDHLMKLAEEVSRDYRQIAPEQLNYRADRQLDEVQAELENVQNALKIDDFDLAAESASRAERAAEEISAHAQQKPYLERAYRSPPQIVAEAEELAHRTAKDSQVVRDIAQKLQQLFPRPDSMLSEPDKSALKQLGAEQRQLGKKAQGLRQQMDELAQLAPIFGQEANDQMDRVGERMGEASQRLEGQDPARGYGEQKAALEQLQRFQQLMRESQGKGKGRGLPMPMFAGSRRMGWGNNRPQEPVQIPDPDQSPNEFRKDLLDAMKQPAPDKYKDQVKRYYEELVK